MPKLFFSGFCALAALASLLPPAAAVSKRLAALHMAKDEALPGGDDDNVLCNLSELDGRLEKLSDAPECTKDWQAFFTRVTDPTPATLDELTKILDDFCKTPCGPVFDKVTVEWRDWCVANPDTAYGPLVLSNYAGTFYAYVSTFGCAKTNPTGTYCATDIAATDNDADPDAEDCALQTSCCAGELARVFNFGVTDDDLAEDEKACPGTIKAFHSKCSA